MTDVQPSKLSGTRAKGPMVGFIDQSNCDNVAVALAADRSLGALFMRRLAALALLIAGCSADSNPETSRLKPGQMVRVPGDLERRILKTATVEGPDGMDFPVGHPGHGGGFLITGDEAEVISDEQPDEGASYQRRWVVVTVTKHQGATQKHDFTGIKCRVPRDRIRPIP